MSNTGSGGSYIIDDKGERVLAVAPTADHPEGNKPREAEAAAVQTSAPESKPTKKPAPAITHNE